MWSLSGKSGDKRLMRTIGTCGSGANPCSEGCEEAHALCSAVQVRKWCSASTKVVQCKYESGAAQVRKWCSASTKVVQCKYESGAVQVRKWCSASTKVVQCASPFLCHLVVREIRRRKCVISSTPPMVSGWTVLRVAMRGREVLMVARGGCSHCSATGPLMCGWSAVQPVKPLSTSANVR
jgi:hypothetical protein